MSKARSWTRNHRRTTFLPTELQIAGEDFETSSDDPLRDEPSKGRQRDDTALLNLLRRGFFSTVLVTSRMIDDEVVPVVVDGRRRVRLSRVVNEERVEKGLSPWQWTVEYQVMKDQELEVARVLNQGHAPETMAQKALYYARLIVQGHTRESAAEVLGVPLTCVPHLEAVADPQCAQWVYKALDEGKIGLHPAAMIAKRPPDEQRAIRERLGDRKLTTAAVRLVVAGVQGKRASVPPPRRRVREILKSGAELPDQFKRAVLFMLGELAPEDVPEIAEHWRGENE